MYGKAGNQVAVGGVLVQINREINMLPLNDRCERSLCISVIVCSCEYLFIFQICLTLLKTLAEQQQLALLIHLSSREILNFLYHFLTVIL